MLLSTIGIYRCLYFCVAWFSVWTLPHLTLRGRTLVHSRVHNSAEHTKVEYRVPPDVLGYLCFLGMIIIHASSDLHPPNPTHQKVTPTIHRQTTNTLPDDFQSSMWKFGRCRRVRQFPRPQM